MRAKYPQNFIINSPTPSVLGVFRGVEGEWALDQLSIVQETQTFPSFVCLLSSTSKILIIKSLPVITVDREMHVPTTI